MQRLRFLLLTICALSIFVGYMIIVTTDPETTVQKLRALFYLCIFSTVLSGSSLLRLLVIPSLFHRTVYIGDATAVIRQGALLGAVVVVFLMLQALRILSLLDAVLIVVSSILFELFFRVRIPITQRSQQ